MTPIPGFPAYTIDQNCNVKNINSGRLLKQEKTRNGYMRVTLCVGGTTKRFLSHRLVAGVFLPNPHGLPCINHKDGDKQNNDVMNLEWCTISHNNQHAIDELGKQAPFGINHYNAKLTDEDVRSIRAARQAGESCRSIGRRYELSHQHVSAMTYGKGRAHVS